MNVWAYVRGGVVAACFLGGIFGSDIRNVDFGYSLPVLAAAAFAFGIVGMLFILGIQFFNSRSDGEWTFPAWTQNPFRFSQPLQFFHFGGYFFLAAGLGALLRSVFVHTTPLAEPVVFTFWGAGILVGVWCCSRAFKKKMVRA